MSAGFRLTLSAEQVELILGAINYLGTQLDEDVNVLTREAHKLSARITKQRIAELREYLVNATDVIAP
jgi:hypothetical protein